MFSCEKGLSGNQAVTAPDCRLALSSSNLCANFKNSLCMVIYRVLFKLVSATHRQVATVREFALKGSSTPLASRLLKWRESIQHTRNMTVPFKKIAESLGEVLPVDLADDVKKNVRAMVQSSLEKMDLVTREELEVQEKVLARTRSQLEALQQRVTELEDALKRSADP